MTLFIKELFWLFYKIHKKYSIKFCIFLNTSIFGLFCSKILNSMLFTSNLFPPYNRKLWFRNTHTYTDFTHFHVLLHTHKHIYKHTVHTTIPMYSHNYTYIILEIIILSFKFKIIIYIMFTRHHLFNAEYTYLITV